jgi:hypothetical protein
MRYYSRDTSKIDYTTPSKIFTKLNTSPNTYESSPQTLIKSLYTIENNSLLDREVKQIELMQRRKKKEMKKLIENEMKIEEIMKI